MSEIITCTYNYISDPYLWQTSKVRQRRSTKRNYEIKGYFVNVTPFFISNIFWKCIVSATKKYPRVSNIKSSWKHLECHFLTGVEIQPPPPPPPPPTGDAAYRSDGAHVLL